jgi:hypothetical protein
MLRGEFYHKVKQLNKNLIIVCNDFDTMANGRPAFAGLGYWDQKEGWMPVCAVDKKELPEYTEYDSTAHIIKTGWRRPILALYAKRLATKEKIQEVFGRGFFEDRHKDTVPIAQDPIKAMMSKKMLQNLDRTGNSGLTDSDIGELGATLDTLISDRDREKFEREKFNLLKNPDKYVADAGRAAVDKAQSSFTSDPNAWPETKNVPSLEIPN